jgi:hypothetical protein
MSPSKAWGALTYMLISHSEFAQVISLTEGDGKTFKLRMQ